MTDTTEHILIKLVEYWQNYQVNKSTRFLLSQTLYTQTWVTRVTWPVPVSHDEFQCHRSAFDTLQHEILIQRLADIGVRDKALEWFRSYLVDRTTSVKVNNSRSCCSLVKYGVPQGSVLEPTLFNVYCRPLGRIIRKDDISYHMYADHSQLYVHFSACGEKTALANLQQCIQEVREWLRENFLLLNENKTEVVIFG